MTPKEKLFKVIDRIEVLKLYQVLNCLSEEEELELRNLEVKKIDLWSEWKD